MPIQRRISELDGVRGIAILLVMLWHYIPRLPLGTSTFFPYFVRLNEFSWSGVDLFFVLSGFLIGGGLIDNREAAKYFSTFYLRRACRILPLYLAVLAILAALEAVGIHETDRRLIPFVYYLTFTQNFWWLMHDWRFSLGQSWSLAVEEQFYLTLPALIWLTPRRWLGTVLVTLACAAPMLRTLVVFVAADPVTAAHVMLPCRMDSLLFGVLAALALRTDAVRLWLVRNGVAIYTAFCTLLGVSAFMLAKHYGVGTDFMRIGGYSVLAALYTAFLLLALRDGPVQKVCSMAWLRKMGIWAYGLYLVHYAVPDLLLRAAGAHPRLVDGYDWSVFALSIVCVFAIAAVSWRYFESPLVAWGHRAKYETVPHKFIPELGQAVEFDASANTR